MQIEDLYLYTSLLGRYRIEIPEEVWKRINELILSSLGNKEGKKTTDKFDQRTCGKLIMSLLRVRG